MKNAAWMFFVLFHACKPYNPEVTTAKSIRTSATEVKAHKHRVMIIDTGLYEQSLPEAIRKRLTHRYTINCDHNPSLNWVDQFFDSKEELLAAIDVAKKSTCILTQSIEDPVGGTPNAYQELEQAYHSNMEPNPNSLSGGNFHGTIITQLIAKGLDHIDFDIVWVRIQTSGREANPLQPSPEESERYQEQFNQLTEWYQDEDVLRAFTSDFAATFPEAILEKLIKVVRMSQPTLVNMSLGGLVRSEFESKGNFSSGALMPYFRARSTLLNSRFSMKFVNAVQGIIFSAAGNEGALINGPEDYEKCGLYRSHLWVIGSYDVPDRISPFSNHGTCVRYYMRGSDLALALPFGHAIKGDGTSYATPLALRDLLVEFPELTTRSALMDAYSRLVSASNMLPMRHFLRDFEGRPVQTDATREPAVGGPP